jgi:hypothetical protein
VADVKLIFERRCVFFKTDGFTNSCSVLREGSSCEGCRFFKHKNDTKNNTLMQDHQLWLHNLPKERAKAYAEAAKQG